MAMEPIIGAVVFLAFILLLMVGPDWVEGTFVKCAVSHCHSRRDPRCRGKNCTKHCNEMCAGACLLTEKKAGAMTVLRGGK